MAVKVFLKNGDELTFETYGFEHNNILHLHGPVESTDQHHDIESRLDSENAIDLSLCATDLTNWMNLQDCEYISGQYNKKIGFGDYYLKSFSVPNNADEELNIIEGYCDELL